MRGELNWWERIGLGFACLSLVTSEFWMDLLGVFLAAMSITRSTWFENRQPTENLQKGWSEAELKSLVNGFAMKLHRHRLQRICMFGVDGSLWLL